MSAAILPVSKSQAKRHAIQGAPMASLDPRRVVRWHSDNGGNQVAIVVKETPKAMHLIPMDAAGIRVRKVAKTEGRYMSDLDYPLAQALQSFRKALKRYGGSRAAKAALRVAV